MIHLSYKVLLVFFPTVMYWYFCYVNAIMRCSLGFQSIGIILFSYKWEVVYYDKCCWFENSKNNSPMWTSQPHIEPQLINLIEKTWILVKSILLRNCTSGMMKKLKTRKDTWLTEFLKTQPKDTENKREYIHVEQEWVLYTERIKF